MSLPRAPLGQGIGDRLGILVNANAKRGGRRVAAQLARALPGASVRLTRRVEEIDEWLDALTGEPGATETGPALRGLFSAGGDGTAVTLLTALARRARRGAPIPPLGALPLGTGNAWAHALGARKLDACVRWLAAKEGPLPTRRYTLFECEGMLTFFAGSGWDAQLLNDYRDQLAQSKGPLHSVNKTVYGYVGALITRTAPKALLSGQARVTIENLGDRLYRLDAQGVPQPVLDAPPGTVIYDGPMGSVGCATCPEFGFRFRAYPFAERFPGLMNVRVYNTRPLRAIADIPRLWAGQFPLDGMSDWFAERVRMTFSRPVPVQVGGEAVGMRRSLDLRVYPQEIEVVDWRGV